MSLICPLCLEQRAVFFRLAWGRSYWACPCCGGIFMEPKDRLPPAQEKARYETHNNDTDNPKYRRFGQPVVDAVLEKFQPSARGLDYGAGTGPVIARMLEERGYSVVLYDPFFHLYPKALERVYDYIVCCEVIEHFFNPAKEFERLFHLLDTGGHLFCKTDIYSDTLDFDTWYYKNDETHTFFYQDRTLEFIRERFGFQEMNRKGRLISFSK